MAPMIVDHRLGHKSGKRALTQGGTPMSVLPLTAKLRPCSGT